MSIRTQALREARRYRSCPPLEIGKDPMHQRQFERHKSICPYCSGEEGDERENWDALAQRMRDLVASRKRKTTLVQVAPGQLRRIVRDEAAWRDGFFYNPPLVLVLKCVGAISDDVKVGQTYRDLALAGPGDLPLTAEQTGLDERFVESWNVYTLKADRLGPLVGEVSPEALEAVLKMIDDPAFSPAWARSPAPMAPLDPRIYFRRLEVEVGYTFAAASVSRLMKEHERGGDEKEDDRFFLHTKQAMEKIAPGLLWSESPSSLDRLFASCRFADQYYAKAAAESERPSLWANVLIFRKHRLEKFYPVEVRGPGVEILAEGANVFGTIPELPRELRWRLCCFLEIPGAQPAKPVETEFNPPDGQFYALFEQKDLRLERISIAVVGEE